MFVDKKLYFEIVNFLNFGVEALYTTKEIGDIHKLFKDENNNNKSSKNIKKYFNKDNMQVVYAKQTHTNNVIDITDEMEKYFFEEVDGFITKRKDIVLMTQFADCLPIFFYDTKNKVIGVSHSGWQGTFKEIGLKTLELMEEKYNSDRKDIIVALGIGISQENYEVGDEFYEKFVNEFPKELLEKSFRYFEEDSRYHFDNTEFNRVNFIRHGILPENIIVSKECTYANDRFHSYRRDKSENRNAGMIFFRTGV